MRSFILGIKSLKVGAALAATMVLILAGGLVRPAMSASYEELLALARQGKAIDYATLRNAYAGSQSYDPYNTAIASFRPPMQKAFAEGDCEGVIKQGQAILERNYVFIDAHMALGICYRRLGQAEQAERHTSAARSLLRAILASGDGKTPKTAFVVISVAEEYSVLGLQGARKVQQALIQSEGRSYDLLTVQNKSGGSEEVYFNVDRVMAWSAEKFKTK
jgi:hypothetical protein